MIIATKEGPRVVNVVKKTEVTLPVVQEERQYDLRTFVPEIPKDYIKRSIDEDINFWQTIDKDLKQPYKSVVLVGESSSGKNYGVINYAAQMGLPLLTIPLDDSQVLKELLGHWKVTKGDMQWCEGLLAQFLQQPCAILFDEANCLPSGKTFMFHELLQNRTLFVKDAPADKAIIKLHPEVHIFLAMNPPEARYSGTNRLNTALPTRTVTIEVLPFTANEIMTHTTGDEKVDGYIKQFYTEALKVIREQKLRVSIGKRNIDTIVKAVQRNLSLENAVMQGFINSALLTASKVERDTLVNLAIAVFGASNFMKTVEQIKRS